MNAHSPTHDAPVTWTFEQAREFACEMQQTAADDARVSREARDDGRIHFAAALQGFARRNAASAAYWLGLVLDGPSCMSMPVEYRDFICVRAYTEHAHFTAAHKQWEEWPMIEGGPDPFLYGHVGSPTWAGLRAEIDAWHAAREAELVEIGAA